MVTLHVTSMRSMESKNGFYGPNNSKQFFGFYCIAYTGPIRIQEIPKKFKPSSKNIIKQDSVNVG